LFVFVLYLKKKKKLLKNPQIAARNLMPPTDDPTCDNLPLFALPMKFSLYPERATRPKAPDLDEHREQIIDSVRSKL
jgi:crotonobetainyl-CoA:carnitine CoA-transferase CaiB-like acyl-CoA transferase